MSIVVISEKISDGKTENVKLPLFSDKHSAGVSTSQSKQGSSPALFKSYTQNTD